MDTIRFGFIGLGGMARAHWNNLRRFSGVQLAAVCDTNVESVNRFGDDASIPPKKRYTDYRKLIADPDVNAVVCITPNDTHAAIIRACLEAGKPFMAEKPFTRTFEEAVELMKLYQTKPVVNMIGFSYRYLPQFRYAKQLVESGVLGAVRHISIQYLQGWGSAITNQPMVWRFDKAVAGTGALGDLGSHMIDMARFLAGEFEEVSGRLATFVHERPDPSSGRMVPVEVDDFAAFHALLRPNIPGPDIPAVFQTSRNAVGSGNQHEAAIFGDRGTLHVSSENRDSVTVLLHKPGSGAVEREEWKVPGDLGLDQWDEFLKVLRGGHSDLITTVVDGYLNQAVLEAVVVSDRERRHVKLSEFPDVRTWLPKTEG